ncbi:MAG TPA: histidine kinase dimerization/phospho-acceptor domain-containing protein [Candidatus Limnocylindria bacterium]|nr:histidine kinase dimerization/phospho-acceptor domain-containing protein [Candidatus Limnocylindria bacterium]
MYTGTKTARTEPGRTALLGVANATLGVRLAREVERFTGQGAVMVVSLLSQLRERLRETTPRAILLDEAILQDAPLIELLRQLTETAPVILLGAIEHRGDISRLIAEGDLEFVARTGDFVPLAASLIERRLRWAERSESTLGPPWAGLPTDGAEILRHEINNPLTGILGNAELVLAHRDRLPAADTQRLQTVVDLAVRLRETTRRLSNAWETHPPSLKSA